MSEINGDNSFDDLDSGKELLRACCAAEPGAWDRFLDQYGKLIYYSIHRTCSLKNYKPAPEELEDLFNDVIIHFIKDDCKKLRLYRGYEGATAATWIRTITVRFIIDYLRQKARRIKLVDITSEEMALEVSHRNPVTMPDEDFEENEKNAAMAEAIEELCENDRYFMELYYGRELGPEEVSQILGISVKTVYSRVNRIKNKLKESVKKRGRK